jgi:hypothetical protein
MLLQMLCFSEGLTLGVLTCMVDLGQLRAIMQHARHMRWCIKLTTLAWVRTAFRVVDTLWLRVCWLRSMLGLTEGPGTQGWASCVSTVCWAVRHCTLWLCGNNHVPRAVRCAAGQPAHSRRLWRAMSGCQQVTLDYHSCYSLISP